MLSLQKLEAALSDARQTISQLRAAAASGEAETQATVSSLLAELAEKSSQLVDAERRFSELEATMQRIASRTGQGQLPGLSALRSSFGMMDLGSGLEPHHRAHSPGGAGTQQQSPGSSNWGARQCGLGGVSC